MKSFLKFTLLLALIISGKLAKEASPADVAKNVEAQTAPNTSVVYVHQLLVPQPVMPVQQQEQPQQNDSRLLAEMF